MMKEHIVKVMKLIDRNYLNRNFRTHVFGANKDVIFRWEMNVDPNKAPHWSLRFKDGKDYFYFNPTNVLESLREFEINQTMFLAYLESTLLNESIFLQMSLEDLEKNLGKERIQEARVACDKFLIEVRKHVDQEMKGNLSPSKFSKRIKISDSE